MRFAAQEFTTFGFRISLCDPLGDRNLFATVPAFMRKFRPKILFLSARVISYIYFFIFTFLLKSHTDIVEH